MRERITFSFGKNWQKFLRFLDKERIENAKISFCEFMGVKDLSGKKILDIGCGSGLFSYAAYLLGAKEIISFDIDPNAVECCKYLHKKEMSPMNWKIYHGSILNEKFCSKFDKFDIVYSWGVLHHTGQMWKAIKEAAKFVKKNGYFYIAIYNKITGFSGSDFWLKVKKLYNALPYPLKFSIEIAYILKFFAGCIFRFKNPSRVIKKFKKERGMNFRTDIIDWLGGYPYEFATIKEVIKFMEYNYPNFKVVNVKATNDLGNNWYLFLNDGT